jgi:hypothetical protein
MVILHYILERVMDMQELSEFWSVLIATLQNKIRYAKKFVKLK